MPLLWKDSKSDRILGNGQVIPGTRKPSSRIVDAHPAARRPVIESSLIVLLCTWPEA